MIETNSIADDLEVFAVDRFNTGHRAPCWIWVDDCNVLEQLQWTYEDGMPSIHQLQFIFTDYFKQVSKQVSK